MTAIEDAARAALLLAVANTSPGDQGVYVAISDLESLLHPAPPTEDDREAVYEVLDLYFETGLFRDMNIPQVNGLFRRQGPITDAQVEAAVGAWLIAKQVGVPVPVGAMRAALEAARAV